MADTSNTGLNYIAESTWGTTPGSPTLTALRPKSIGLKPMSDTKISEEIRADSQIPDVLLVGRHAEGPIEFEWTYGTWDTLLESGQRAVWATNVLSNGVTRKSVTLEKVLLEGATKYYELITGGEVSGWSARFPLGDIATGTFNLMGKYGGLSSTSVSATAITAAPTGGAMSTTSITAITEGGSALARVQEITLDVNGGSRKKTELGSTAPFDLGTGRFNVTGSMKVYFAGAASVTLFNKHINMTASSLSWTISDGTSSYNFAVKKLKFPDGEIQVPGNDQDVLLDIKFQGIYDSVSGKTLTITRTP